MAGLAVAVAHSQANARQALIGRFESRTQGVAGFVSSYTQELANRQRRLARDHLSGLAPPRAAFERVSRFGGFRAAVLLSDEGRLLQVTPRAPAQLGTRVAHRYPHMRAAVDGKIGVSGVVRSVARGTSVSAIAVPFETPYGWRVFSGAYDLASSPIGAYLKVSMLSSAHVVLVDADGRQVAAQARDTPKAGRARRISVSRSVEGTPWRVIASVSRSEWLRPLDGPGHYIPWLVLIALSAMGVGTIRLHAARRETDQTLFEERERAQAGFEHAATGMAISGVDGRCIQVNVALCAMLGYTRDELLAGTMDDVTHPDDIGLTSGLLAELLEGGTQVVTAEQRYLRAAGDVIWGLLSLSVVRDAAGSPLHYVSQVHDITERRRLRAELEHLAGHDPLTGVFNRRRFEEHLTDLLRRARRYGERAALLLIDLDHFKAINDTHGHQVGDDVLRAVAQAVQGRLRDSDCLARLGGDEFAVQLLNVGPDDAATIAEHLSDVICAVRVPAAGASIGVTASIGIAFIDGECDDEQSLVEQADLAMYTAKARGRNTTVTAEQVERVRVYHCDDSPAYRRLAAEMLRAHPDIEIVGSAASYAVALDEAPSLLPDVMLLDMYTGEEAFDPVARVRHGLPGAAVVVLSALTSAELIQADLGADAALSKTVSFTSVAAELRRVTAAGAR
jgi:diguanylate cyclase (GGDEF)-like protein/PAS domain S-box-containing protein